MFDYKKAKHGGTEKEIIAYEKKHSPKKGRKNDQKSKALRKMKLHPIHYGEKKKDMFGDGKGDY